MGIGFTNKIQLCMIFHVRNLTCSLKKDMYLQQEVVALITPYLIIQNFKAGSINLINTLLAVRYFIFAH